jgi:hypothetical protein
MLLSIPTTVHNTKATRTRFLLYSVCDSIPDVQVFLGRGDMAACALECAHACTTPHHWAALLAILQAGTASLQEQPDAHSSHQDLAEELREVLFTPCQPGTCCLRACWHGTSFLHARTCGPAQQLDCGSAKLPSMQQLHKAESGFRSGSVTVCVDLACVHTAKP